MQSFLQLCILTVRIFFFATSVTPASQQNTVPRNKSVLDGASMILSKHRLTDISVVFLHLGSLYRSGQRMFGPYHHLALHNVLRFSTRYLQFTACTLK